MIKPSKGRYTPKGQVRIMKRIHFLEDECTHYRMLLAADIDADKRRVVWCRLEDNRVELAHLRSKLRQAKPRCKPAPEAPLFTFNGKEVS